MIEINNNIIKFYEKDTKRMINILIYNILRNENKTITILIRDDYKQILLKKINSKKLLLGDNIQFISEKELYKNRVNSDIYILMYSHLFENKKRIIEVIGGSYIDIGKPSIHDTDEYKENKILVKHNKLDMYRYKWENKKIINNEEIIEWIIDTLEIAENRAYFECPWYNEDAFDRFKKVIVKAVNRGIDVRIRFGINCENDIRFNKTQEIIDDLILDIGISNNFKVIKSNTHIKQVLIDNWYLHSSMNFGSNSLNYDNCPDENATINLIYKNKEIKKIVNRFKENG